VGALWCVQVVVGAGAGPIFHVLLFPCGFLPLTPRGSVGRVGARLLNGFEADGVYEARSTLKEITFKSVVSALACQMRSSFRHVLIKQ